MTKPIKTITAVAFASALLLAPVQAWAQADPDLTPVIEATVRVEATSTGRKGTGWVIEASNQEDRAGAAVIVTSYNIIEGSSNIQVREPITGISHDATVLSVDPDRNLAFLEVKDVAAAPIPLTRSSPAMGNSVFATGFNRAADASQAATAPTATTKRGSLGREYRGPITTEARADVNQLEHDAPLLAGFEGGPLVDLCGRVIGINMKSGGDVTSRRRVRIVDGAPSMNALRADEVIAAANSNSVSFESSDNPCNGAAPVAAEPGPAAMAAAEPDSSAGGEGIGGWLRNNLLLVALLLLGLVAALFGLMTLLRRKDGSYDEPNGNTRAEFSASRVEPAGAAPAAEEAGTVLIGDTRTATTKVETLRLTGRGPAGEPIDLQFESTALAESPMTLGVGANADKKIADNRADHKVSRMHAKIGYNGTHFTVEDNKSLNKTKVRGREIEPYEPTPIMHGDTITLADLELAVSVQ